MTPHRAARYRTPCMTLRTSALRCTLRWSALPQRIASSLQLPAATFKLPPPTLRPRTPAERCFCATARPPAQRCIDTIYAALIDAKEAAAAATPSETFEPSLDADGKILLDLGEKGQYGLEALPDGRVLLFSPLIGPRYYDWDAENEWFYDKADGHLLVELLVRELMHITSVCVNL
mmetsp:Transcript_51336/g.171340  ORF Transcript_51336/g.171340 Transcript_51336/m.171340 type:complete len:176 (+) Transcript_51336:2-529(+)